MAKNVIPRAEARRDFDHAVDYYLREAGADVAFSFVDALEEAYEHLGRHPGTGSLRYSYEMDLPGLRFWAMKRFPYLIFFIERDDHVDVRRVIHGARDIPNWLRDGKGK